MPLTNTHPRLRARRRRSWVRLTAVVLTVAATFAIAATGASGVVPGKPIPIQETGFEPVVQPWPVAPRQTSASLAVRRGDVEASDVQRIAASLSSSAPRERPQPSVPEAKPIVVVRLTHSISGNASWYCRAGWSICTDNHPDTSGFQAYAAAGPALRRALGPGWRGSVVYVDGVRVKLIDWCQCHEGESNEKLLDLYYDVFARTGSRVTIRW